MSTAITKYCNTINLWYKSEGNQGLKRAKVVFTIMKWITTKTYTEHRLRLYLQAKGVELRLLWFESHQTRYPRVLKGLLPQLLGTIREQRVALTVGTCYRIFDSKVNDSHKVDFMKELESTETLLDQRFLRKFKLVIRGLLRVLRLKLTPNYIPFTDRVGPSGPNAMRIPDYALALSATVDIRGKALGDSVTELYRYFNLLCKYKPDIDWREYLPASDLRWKTGLSRLSVIPDKGGKVRKVAMVDFFSQQVLYPLHKCIMKGLRRLPSDFSHDHDLGFAKLLKFSRTKTIWSCDLTEFSTNIPRELIKITILNVCEHLSLNHLGKNVESKAAEAWLSLLCERRYPSLMDSSTLVNYSNGSPMGVYTSWPLSVLIHHALVICAWYDSSVPTAEQVQDIFQHYALVGDDIGLDNQFVFERYLSLVSKLGMSVSQAKVCVPKWKTSADNVVLFASRLGINGTNLTPGSLVDLYQLYKTNFDITRIIHKAKTKLFKGLFRYFSHCRFAKRATIFRKILLTLPREMGGKAASLQIFNEAKPNKKETKTDEHNLITALISSPYFMMRYVLRQLKKVEKNFQISIQYVDSGGLSGRDLIQSDNKNFSTFLDEACDDIFGSPDLYTCESDEEFDSLYEDEFGDGHDPLDPSSETRECSIGSKSIPIMEKDEVDSLRVHAFQDFLKFRLGEEIIDFQSSHVKDHIRKSFDRDTLVVIGELDDTVDGDMPKGVTLIAGRRSVHNLVIDFERLDSVLDQVRKVVYFKCKGESFPRTLYDTIKDIARKIYSQKPYQEVPNKEIRIQNKRAIETLLSKLREVYQPPFSRNSFMYTYW